MAHPTSVLVFAIALASLVLAESAWPKWLCGSSRCLRSPPPASAAPTDPDSFYYVRSAIKAFLEAEENSKYNSQRISQRLSNYLTERYGNRLAAYRFAPAPPLRFGACFWEDDTESPKPVLELLDDDFKQRCTGDYLPESCLLTSGAMESNTVFRFPRKDGNGRYYMVYKRYTIFWKYQIEMTVPTTKRWKDAIVDCFRKCEMSLLEMDLDRKSLNAGVIDCLKMPKKFESPLLAIAIFVVNLETPRLGYHWAETSLIESTSTVPDYMARIVRYLPPLTTVVLEEKK